MEDNTNVTLVEDTVPSTEENYIEQIKALRANSVDRAKYDKVIEENKQLTQALIDGGQIQGATVVQEEPDISAIAESLLHESNNNLSYISKALQYRQAIMDKFDVDVFVSGDPTHTPTGEDYETAARTAEVLQNCVDVADGDPAVFQSELQRVLVDNNNWLKGIRNK